MMTIKTIIIVRDHEALLLKIDSVLMKQQEGVEGGVSSEYDMYSALPPPSAANPVRSLGSSISDKW